MKINRLLILAALPMIGLTANAQEKGPQRNDFTVAATVSYDATVKEDAQPGNQMQYTLPTQSTNWNDKELRVGIEGGWFFLDEWKLVLGGGMSITKHPGYSAVPGTVDENTDWSDANDGSIPDYNAVPEQNFVQFNVYTGVDRYFKTKVDGLYLYAGARVGYAYGRNISNAHDEYSMGESVGEAFNIRGALTGGVEYYITDALFVGAQVDPFASSPTRCSWVRRWTRSPTPTTAASSSPRRA